MKAKIFEGEWEILIWRPGGSTKWMKSSINVKYQQKNNAMKIF